MYIILSLYIPPSLQVFDSERSRLEKEYHDSKAAVQTLRRGYNKYLSATTISRGKLETALARDPPKLPEQDRWVGRSIRCIYNVPLRDGASFAF